MSKLSAQDSDRIAKRMISNHIFPGASHAAIEAILARGLLRKFADGATLCEEGETAGDLFFLVRGTVLVRRADTTGDARKISDIRSPCVFGHMSLIDGSKRSASCVAEGPVECVSLSEDRVRLMLSETTIPGTALRRLLISSLCGQLSSANEYVRNLVNEAIPPTPEVKKPAARRLNTENIGRISAKLGGWDAGLGGLEEMEKELEFVVDEDTRRRQDLRKQR
jgi:CRP-like cAMP-binding protein